MVTPYLADHDFTLHVGDVLDILPQLPARSVHCCVTSPPYWGLRDYGTGEWEGGDPDCDHTVPLGDGGSGAAAAGYKSPFRAGGQYTHQKVTGNLCKCGASRVDRQLGLEATPEEYVARMVTVFRMVRRVLRDDGTLWLNLGDSYSHGGNGSRDPIKWPKQSRNDHRVAHAKAAGDTKPKDLLGIPWRVAFALQQDGWCLRSEIVWAKPNPMPESVTDRPTKAHEQLFLLTKCKWVGPERGQFAHISEDDARWLALLFDTEGNICVKRTARAERRQYGAQVTFANCSLDLLERAHGIVGAGSISTRAGTNAPVHYWQLGSRQAADLLYRIAPHLIVKQRQARVAIHMHDVVSAPQKRPGGYRTVEHEAFLEKCWRTVKALNSFESPDISWLPELKYGRWIPNRYFYDADAIREPWTGDPEFRTPTDHMRNRRSLDNSVPSAERRGPDGRRVTKVEGRDGSAQHRNGERWPNQAGRNKRSVWEIATEPYPDAHFATYPQALIQPCIQAGSPEHGTVLDPFLGSGTTALVARRHGRHSIGIELNPAYAELAARRLAQQSLLTQTEGAA